MTVAGKLRPVGNGLRRALAMLVVLVSVSGCVVTRHSFEPSSDGPVLTVWSYLTRSGSDQSLRKLDAMFERRHPTVRIRHVTVPINEFGPKLLAAAGTGEGPDVIIGNPVVDFELLSKAGVYAPLDDYWSRYADRSAFPEDALWQAEGHTYAVQWRFNDLGLWYNKDILAEYGLRPPRTVPELERAMATVTDGGKYRGITFSGEPSVQSTWQFVTWLLGEGVNYCTIDSPRTEDVSRRFADWVRKGYPPPDVAALGPEDSFQKFLTGKYAFAQAGSWEVGLVNAEPPAFDIGSARLPAGAVGSHMSFAGESVGIGTYSNHKDLAWDYVRGSYLSQAGQLATFSESGAIPTREDARKHSDVTQVTLARPFVEALSPRSLRPWPENPNTLNAQTELGTVFSSMLSGDLDPRTATRDMRRRVNQAFEEGGGGC